MRGVRPYPDGKNSGGEYIEAGSSREEFDGQRHGKRQAITKGRTLVARLNQETAHRRRDGRHDARWRLRVTQNAGWHYTAVRGPLTIRPDYGARGQVSGYHAFFERGALNTGLYNNGRADATLHARTPEAAYQKAIVAAQRFLDGVFADIQAARGRDDRGKASKADQ